MKIIKFEQVENLIISINNINVIIDSDVATLYGVETKRINEAVRNNPEKFPEGYVLILNENDLEILRSKFSTAKFAMTRTVPKAFTEKGLYMLATILKSAQATQTTLAIIETFTKIRELSRTVTELSDVKDKNHQKALMQKSGNLIAEILDDDLETTETETSIELNFAVLKFKHTVKRK